MNEITVQLKAGNPYNSGSAVYLHFDDGRCLQLGFNIEDYARAYGTFDQNAAEFAYFTSVIYGCDRAVNRESFDGDRWTREYAVQIPVADPVKWSAALDLIEPMLEFLTGDIWHLEFVAASIHLFGREFRAIRNNFRKRSPIRGDVVSLFSGGLDSLIGVIGWFDYYPNTSIVLASTYDPQAENSRTDQLRLLPHLKTGYPRRVYHYVARTGFCVGGEDTNFRSRSLSFIGNAVLAASFLGHNAPIIIPENGAIALNYPLTPARRASLSTRTVHPHFLTMLSRVLQALGLQYPLYNPYNLSTKGEMMKGCRNDSLLLRAYADSASCGKRGHKEHWDDKGARQCGACVPCIFRRAAILSVGFPAERYGYDLTPGDALRRIQSDPNSDLSAIIDFVERDDNIETIWFTLRANGRLDFALKTQYTSLVIRLREEVKSWAQNMGLL